MTASSLDRALGRALRATALALALLAAPGLALAQSQPGQGTGSEAEDVGAPTPLIPFDSSARQGSGALPGEALPEVQGIVIDRLSALDPNAIGLLDPDTDGLGQGLWQVSERGRLEALLARLPGDLRSATLRGLARRMLLSRAVPPKGDGPEAQLDPQAGEGQAVVAPRFLALRIDRLLALGLVEDLQALLAAVPRMIDDEGIQRARAETSFLRGDLDGGCREVRNGVTAHVAQPYWREALVICQLASGERAQAQLGLGLLQESGLEDSGAFLALFDALSGGEGELEAASVTAPLPFAALQSVGLTPPDGFLEVASPGLLVAAALSAKSPAVTRIGATEKAVALGALGPERLAEAYGALSFSAEELLGADEAGFEGPPLRALRYQRVADRKEPGALARALREALTAADEAGVYRAMVPLVIEEFRKVPVQTGLAWFAGTAGRALYSAGRIELGGAWYQLARDQALRNSAAKLAAGALWPYFRLAGGPTLSQGGDPLAAWRAGLGDDVDEAAAGRWEALLRASLDGLAQGVATSGAAANGASTTVETDQSRAAELAALEAASQGGRRGETLLIALGLIGGQPPAEVEPAALKGVLAALVRTGLQREARELAIEVTVASGL